MKVIYIKPTDTCNLDCDHCFTSGSKGARTIWDINAIVPWLNDLSSHFNDEHIHIELHGGEPFLRPIEEHWEFYKKLSEATGERFDNISIAATTNLIYKLKEDHIRFFKHAFYGQVGTSWDPVYRFKTEGMYKLWLDNIKTLRDHDIDVKMFVTVTDELLKIPSSELLETWNTFGVTSIAIERLTMDGNALHHPNMFPDNRAIDQFYYDLYLAYKKASVSYEITTLDAIENKFKTHNYHVDTNCRTCEQNLFTIGADGKVGGCANGAKKESADTIYQSLNTTLDSSARLERIVHESTHNPKCLTCDLFEVCIGDCHRLPWQGDSCPGLTKLLRHFKYGDQKIPTVNL